MLKKLSIQNFALIENLEIGFGAGMNVLTGETGAGKSIIIGALSRLLGEKAGKDDIRSGKNLAVLEAEFDIPRNSNIKKLLDLYEINIDGGNLIIRKEINLGRSARSFLNGQLANLSQIRELTGQLAELFGQHSHQLLLDEKNHLRFLDEFASLTGKVIKLNDQFDDWQSAMHDLKKLIASKTNAKREHELLIFQKEEIENAEIRIGEEIELKNEQRVLDSAQALGEKSSSILEMLETDDHSALDILNNCAKEFQDMTRLDNSLKQPERLLNETLINIGEFRAELERYQSNIIDDPKRLEEINLRLDELYRLKQKYGGSEESIINRLIEINKQLEIKIDVDEHIKLLSEKELNLKDEYIKRALEISSIRKEKSKILSTKVIGELKKLGIESAEFKIEFIYEDDKNGFDLDGRLIKPTADGFESCRFLISANPKEPVKPLIKTASGGEISRIMLALKASGKASRTKSKPLLVFDEIDSGIGGITAGKVAERIARLGREHQLLVVTHLHQIAALGNNHYAVTKILSKSSRGRNVVSVSRLDKAARKLELARMIALPEDA